uniref:Uncharacterized protein n=1 Tax=Arundo donax TaxID=35708 RepID=A0A0A9C7I9_ARUDO
MLGACAIGAGLSKQASWPLHKAIHYFSLRLKW